MRAPIKTLPEVFEHGFSGDCLEMASKIGVISVGLNMQSRTMDLTLLPPRELTEEERTHLLACLDIAMQGQVELRISFAQKAEEEESLDELPEIERTRRILDKYREEEPGIASVLSRCRFEYGKDTLILHVPKAAALLMKQRSSEKAIEEILKTLGMEKTVQVESDGVLEEINPLRRTTPAGTPTTEERASGMGVHQAAPEGMPYGEPIPEDVSYGDVPPVPADLPFDMAPPAQLPPWEEAGPLPADGADAPQPQMTDKPAPDNSLPKPAAGKEEAGSGAEQAEEEAKPKRKTNRVMTGKPIQTKDEVPLSRCDVEIRQVVTRGIISQISIREISGGKGILSIRITDYVSTVNVKAFVVMKTWHEKMENLLVKGESILVKGSLQMDSYVQDLVLTATCITLLAEPIVIDEAKKAAIDAMVLGRPFEGPRTNIHDVLNEQYLAQHSGKTILQGDIITTEARELKNDRTLMTIDITDYTDSISVKAFFDNEDLEKKGGMLKKGKQIKVLGKVSFDDQFSHEYQMMADSIAPTSDPIKPERKDNAPRKRVELHLHTKISEMDAVTAPKEMVMQAYRWGHPAIAITDHGVVQGFPEAMDAARKCGIKVIYGVEAYIVDDTKLAVKNDHGQDFSDTFVVFDIETTGFNKESDRIIEIGAVKVQGREIVDRFSRFIDPEMPIPEHITKLTSITDDDVRGQGTIREVLPEFKAWVGDAAFVAHNASFDTGFIANKNEKLGYAPMDNTIVDTLELARGLYDLKRYTLDSVAKALGVDLRSHHRAVDDAEATAGIFLRCLTDLMEKKIIDLSMINTYIHDHTDVKKLRSHHAILLVQNKVGLKNLYKLISESHLNYFYRQPRMPKSVINSMREGIIVGSACSAGELYEAVLENDSQEELERLVSFYDYLEIQPLANNMYLIDDPDHGNVQTVEDLKNINRRIVELGKIYHKPVVATCDAHFKDPSDEEFRRILLSSMKFSDADKPMPLYLRTTEEMLEEFSYLGEETCEQVVIDAPNSIADQVEVILPIPDGQFSPVIEGAEDELRNICYENAKKMYGDPLPDIVQARLDHELGCIIGNGFSTLYILARRLVQHSVADGYYVGSRGSVGSSFAATMAGITEVNPLKAHYYCPECHFTDFDPEESRGVAGMSGFDLPDRMCPRCGKKLKKDGQEIPFEVFLGFNGDKEPDIDLNFSGEYQPKAHAYVGEMFGEDHVYRAGTMGGLAEKTAYGMVKHYLEDHGRVCSNAQINYLISGCLEVKRTTGQHPGGILVVPTEYDVYDFTPIQHPANDMTTSIITSHYDYDPLHGRLLKLDILGHDDPTMIRMLEDMTGTVATEVPIDDPGVMQLFLGTESLGVTPEQIDSPVGTYGISEFGTHFVRQMLVDTKPKNFSDLCRISGLSHGTDVWNNNAKDIVAQGIASISECICTREDIMIDLIHLGMDKLESFKIMEKVRKGKKSGGLSPTDIEHMVAHGIEPWYLESCKKIQYLFPKGHAVAYVTMSLRIAYYKVHYKEYYYAAFFTIRADSFDYATMAMGEQKARAAKAAIEAKGQKEQTAKDKEIHTLLELVIEFYARGLSFLPMDLAKSDDHKFQVIDGKLLPPFDTISGMGQTAARSIVEAREEGEFLTVEDFLGRTRVSRTITDTMKTLGIIDLPETDQLSLF
ncbi:MAG: PolC-type DNA polymerase III [Firmicutes bacterium]|nr:PolC-type DNA polymerase III [Bacillota bacterium]